MNPPAVRSAALNACAGVRHAFFGRRGGVSDGIYSSLNAGLGSGDSTEAVGENRSRIAAALNIPDDRLIGLHQVHSAHAVFVDGPWRGKRPEADALVTRTRGLAISVVTADCAPVLLADAEAGLIGAAHAGWRGALGGVLEACVALMIENGAQPARIAAAIGPCIGRESYEVGPDFREKFVAASAANAGFFSAGAGDRLRFDLEAYCAARLSALGVGRIDALARDTCALETDYFSNRRAVKRQEGDYGRNCSALVLAG